MQHSVTVVSGCDAEGADVIEISGADVYSERKAKLTQQEKKQPKRVRKVSSLQQKLNKVFVKVITSR